MTAPGRHGRRRGAGSPRPPRRPDRRSRRRLVRWLTVGWATPLGLVSVVGVVLRLPDGVGPVVVAVVVTSVLVVVVPILLATILAVLESPGMTERLCRVIAAVRGVPDDPPRGGRSDRRRPKR